MLVYILEYEALINLVSFGLLVASVVFKRDVIFGISFMICFVSVIINGIYKGF